MVRKTARKGGRGIERDEKDEEERGGGGGGGGGGEVPWRKERRWRELEKRGGEGDSKEDAGGARAPRGGGRGTSRKSQVVFWGSSELPGQWEEGNCKEKERNFFFPAR